MPNYENLNQINKLRKELFGENVKDYCKWTKEDLDRFRNQPQTQLLQITGPKSNKVIGLAVITLSTSLTKRSLTIEDLIIGKKHRNKGMGIYLLKNIILLARGLNVDSVEVATKKVNKIAQKIYKKMDFINRNNISYRLWLK